MCKTTTVTPSNARKGEVPDAFRKIKAMESNPRRPPYDRYSPEGIRTEREELKEKMRLFWNERTDFPRKLDLFAPGYDWSEHCAYAGLELKAGRDRETRKYYPSEEMMQIFILLSEREFDRACSKQVRNAFSIIEWGSGWGEEAMMVSQTRLVRILSPSALTRLIHSIDGGHIAKLLIDTAASDDYKPWNEKEGLAEKIVETFEVGNGIVTQSEQKLGDYLVLNPNSSVLNVLRRATNEKARTTAEYLVKRLEDARKSIQEILDSLKGERGA